jgi:hypothetical protein
VPLPGYVPPSGERDLDKIVRGIRNLYENAAGSNDVSAALSRIVAALSALTLDDISDVNAPSPTDGQALVWDAGNSEWIPGAAPSTGRELLTADRTYYVRTDGSDSNDGLTNNSGGAFLTIAKAIDAAVALDPSIYTITIQVGAGTWTTAITLKHHIGTNAIILQGDTGTPANVTISTTGVSAITAQNVWSPWTVQGFKVQTTTIGYGFNIVTSRVAISQIEFGAMASGYSHINAQQGARVNITSNYTYSGNAAVHWNLDYGATLFAAGLTITASGSRAFTFFAQARNLSLIVCNNNTFVGTTTGTRYNVSNNAVIDTLGGGANYLPGNAAGAASAGGQYV